jgi:mannobiose 2-epimerase
MTEYFKATGDKESLEKAKKTYRLMEKHSHDDENGGYFEAFERDWTPSGDIRIGGKKMKTLKSMNTHLHVLEAYTNLYGVWRTDELEKRIREMTGIFLEHIINRENHHFHLYLNEEYEVLSEEISYGHDIEGTWLLYEAAEAMRDDQLKEQIRKVALNMADATLEEGMDPDGGLIYEASPEGVTNSDKSWWPQAESVVGFYNAFQLSDREKYRKAAFKSWEFIRENLTDKQYGEWFRRVSREGKRYPDDMKVSAWKGPYHNSRMCFEMIERLGRR